MNATTANIMATDNLNNEEESSSSSSYASVGISFKSTISPPSSFLISSYSSEKSVSS